MDANKLLVYCLGCACLALTYRHYLINEGGLLWFVPGLIYKALPMKYEDWNGLQKAFEKITVVCSTCQAGQIAFWLWLLRGGGLVDSFLCAGMASVMAHIIDNKFFV